MIAQPQKQLSCQGFSNFCLTFFTKKPKTNDESFKIFQDGDHDVTRLAKSVENAKLSTFMKKVNKKV